ncbi:MAG TPA: hypothetical protein VMS12_12090 [Thermoanaerobaculia bacterium]|nr:hypothetical protein [Thermoanaerobaculia bacterium]
MNAHEAIEREVVETSRSGRVSETLRDHIAECASCKETASVAGFMQRLAGAEKDAPLPDPGIVRLKAQLLQNQLMEEQASQALSRVQRTTWILIGTCWATVLVWKWGTVESWLGDASLSRRIMESVSGGAGISLPFVLMLVGLMAATGLLAVHSVLADE